MGISERPGWKERAEEIQKELSAALLQISELNAELDAEKADARLRCGCEFDKDHKQTAECGFHSNQRNNDLRLNGELRLAGQRARGQLREVLKLGMFAPESSAHVYAAHEALDVFEADVKRIDEHRKCWLCAEPATQKIGAEPRCDKHV